MFFLLFFLGFLHILVGQYQITYCIYYSSMASLGRRPSAGLVYNADLSPTGNIWSIMKCKIWQRSPIIVEQLQSCIRPEWSAFLWKRSSSWLPQFPDVCRLYLNVDGVLHSLPCLRHVFAIKFKSNLCFSLNNTMLEIQYLMFFYV